MSGEHGRERWRPKARLIRMIGDELVSSPKVALVELVKNAYDADATEVVVGLREEGGQSALEVRDNGVGMSRDTVLNEWLVPGTVAKKRRTITEECGRRVLGEKGIGRFAAATLGRHLELVTRERGGDEIVVYVDWDTFSDEETFLDEVGVEWEAREPRVFRDSHASGGDRARGTLIRISGLRFRWSEEFAEELKNTLGRLVSPFRMISDFRIRLEILGQAEEVEPAGILERPMYKLVGEILPDGAYQVDVTTSSGTEKTNGRIDLGRLRCGPFRIEVRAWDRDEPSLGPVAKVLKMTMKDVREDLDRFCGASIYRDGFRVLPYGDEGQDWLGLDLRSRLKPGFNLANNQVVGVIEIGADSNPGLVDQTNREGIRETEAFRDLKKAVLEIINKLERARFRHKRASEGEGSPGMPPVDPLEPFRLSGVRSVVSSAYSGDPVLRRAVEEEEEKILSEVGRYRKVMGQYARLATLGGLIDKLLHEGRRPLAMLRNDAQLGARESGEWPEPFGPKAQARFQTIDGHAGVLHHHFKALEPFAPRKRGRPSELAIEEVVRRAAALYDTDLRHQEIQVTIPGSRTMVTIDPIEVGTVFANLFDNSLYWLQRVPPPRRITVGVTREADGSVVVMFSDNGPGIPEEDRPHIFEPYYTTKPDGTGLGLAISGFIMEEYYGGSIALLSEGPLPGATFRIVLRRRTGV